MSAWPLLSGYLGIGALATLCTMIAFPPSPGYRPVLAIRLLAVAVYTLFWPALVLIAVIYLSTCAFDFTRGRFGIDGPANPRLQSTGLTGTGVAGGEGRGLPFGGLGSDESAGQRTGEPRPRFSYRPIYKDRRGG